MNTETNEAAWTFARQMTDALLGQHAARLEQEIADVRRRQANQGDTMRLRTLAMGETTK